MNRIPYLRKVIFFRSGIFIVLCCCLLFTGLVQKAQAQKILKAIHFTQQSKYVEQVRLEVEGNCILRSFTIKGDNPRIVFDLEETGMSRKINSTINVNGTLVDRIRVARHKGADSKTRVVFDMVTLDKVTYSDHYDEQAGIVTIDISKKTHQNTTPKLSDTSDIISPQPLIVPEGDSEPATKKAQVTKPQPTPAKEIEPASSKGKEEKPLQVSGAPSGVPVLESVSYENSSTNGELIMFKLNGFFPPQVHAVEEGVPRAVCDFKNAVMGDGIKNLTKVNGKYVRSIRVGKHTNPDKIRVVLDLTPNNNYDLQQIFFKEDNLFVIIVDIVKGAE